MESHVRAADAVLITKASVATTEQIEAARAWILGLRPEVPLFAADMASEDRLKLEALLPCVS